jgi:hypothetical protein
LGMPLNAQPLFEVDAAYTLFELLAIRAVHKCCRVGAKKYLLGNIDDETCRIQ